jgi:hypothetical protein
LTSSRATRALAAAAGVIGQGAGHHNNPVVVGDDDVARAHRGAGANHRDVHAAESSLDGSAGGNGARPHGKFHRRERGDVAAARVDHQAAHASRHDRRSEQFAKHAVGAVGGDGNHQNVSGLAQLDGHMNHPVVAGLREHGYRAAGASGAHVDGAHVGLHQAQTAHGLVNGGDAAMA